jgi:hypothetical protein
MVANGIPPNAKRTGNLLRRATTNQQVKNLALAKWQLRNATTYRSEIRNQPIRVISRPPHCPSFVQHLIPSLEYFMPMFLRKFRQKKNQGKHNLRLGVDLLIVWAWTSRLRDAGVECWRRFASAAIARPASAAVIASYGKGGEGGEQRRYLQELLHRLSLSAASGGKKNLSIVP